MPVWSPSADGWYCVVARPTGETATFQGSPAIPYSSKGGATIPNLPGAGGYQKSVTGATYPTALTGFPDGVANVPLCVVKRSA